jgi:succinyl-CoA synthetase alpha subunit
MAKDDERTTAIVYEGTSKTIAYAIDANGSMPAKDFIECLRDDDKRKLLVLFSRMGDVGRIANYQKFKKLESTEFQPIVWPPVPPSA